MLTQHNDNARTGVTIQRGLNRNAFATWGLKGVLRVDGTVWSQPLVMSQVPVPGGPHRNLVFIATATNKVYAFEAEAWPRSGVRCCLEHTTMRRLAIRSWRRRTVVLLIRSWRASARLPNPAALPRIRRARRATRWDVVPARTQAVNWRTSVAVNFSATAGPGMYISWTADRSRLPDAAGRSRSTEMSS
jgi:hypothetical protein